MRGCLDFARSRYDPIIRFQLWQPILSIHNASCLHYGPFFEGKVKLMDITKARIERFITKAATNGQGGLLAWAEGERDHGPPRAGTGMDGRHILVARLPGQWLEASFALPG